MRLNKMFNGYRLKRKVNSGAFGTKGCKEVTYLYTGNHGLRHSRTGEVTQRTTRICY